MLIAIIHMIYLLILAQLSASKSDGKFFVYFYGHIKFMILVALVYDWACIYEIRKK